MTTTNTNTNTVEYVTYIRRKDNLDKFYSIFINKNENNSQLYIPFLKKSFDNYDDTAQDISSIISTRTNLLSVNNFAKIQSQALKGKISHTLRPVSATNTTYNSNNSTAGFLNFTTRDSDYGSNPSSLATVANIYIVTESVERKNLIYATIEIIEIFINILEAYKKFIIKSHRKNMSMDTITDIFIVGNKVKKTGDHASDNMAVYVENRIGKSPINGYNFPASNTLFLIIKSFDNDIMDDTTALTDDAEYRKFYKKKFIFGIDGIPTVTSSAVEKENDLFSEDELSLNKSSIFSGILLSNSVNGLDIKYNGADNVDDFTKISTEANKDIIHSTNKRLCSVILKNFLYYLHTLQSTDINIQINALLYYYKIMKCYLLNSVYIGNYLFNTQYVDGNNEITAGQILSNIVAIDPIITTNTKIGDQFQPQISTTPRWTYLNNRNNVINNTLNNLTKEIENSISGNNVQNNSIIHPSIFKGFYVKKKSETIIELSSVVSPLRKDRSDNPFATHLKNYDTSPTFNKVFFDNRGNIIDGLSEEEEYLANILKNNSTLNINKEIKKKYQIEINSNLYSIDNIVLEADALSNQTILKIDILAKFEYLNIPPSITNTSKLFKFERNTYDVFPDKTNITHDNIAVQKEIATNVFDVTTGQVKSSSAIEGKYILLYNYYDHPKVKNHVIFNKSVNLKKNYNEDMNKIKNINESIVFNETKINNSGRLYDIQDKEYSILYNQLIVYYVVIAILFCIIIIMNYADVESELVVMVTTVCFATIVILFISYYLVHIVYIEKYVNVENFNIEHFNISNINILQYDNGLAETTGIPTKVSNIQASMNELCYKLDNIIEILMVAIPQVEFVETNKILNGIVENEKNEKINVNKLLDHKRINSYNFIDIKKYDIKALNTLIKTVLATALVIFGFYTIHFYVNNKYNDILIFLCAIFLIIIFTYYIIYSNRVVRTISKNVYWGKEFKNSYVK